MKTSLLNILNNFETNDLILKKQIMKTLHNDSLNLLSNVFLINILLNENIILFIPTGYKSNKENILNFIKNNKLDIDSNNVEILKELSIKYSETLYDNITLQFPNIFKGFSHSEASIQKKIYGYLIRSSDHSIYKKGISISHIFTNKNTTNFLSNHKIVLSDFISKILQNEYLENYKICISGSLLLNLYGFDTQIDNIEFWSYDDNLNNIDCPYTIKNQKYVHPYNVEINILPAQYLNKKNKLIHIPKQMLIIYNPNEKNMKQIEDIIFDENKFIYINGIKILKVFSDFISDVLDKKQDEIFNIVSRDKPSKQIIKKISNVIKYAQLSSTDRINNLQLNPTNKNVFVNCNLGNCSTNGYWILRKNGEFDFIEELNIWITNKTFIAFGKLKVVDQKIVLYCNYNSNVISKCLEYNLDNTPDIDYEIKFLKTKKNKNQKKYNEQINYNNNKKYDTNKNNIKKNNYILNVSQRGDSVSVFSSLLL